MKKITLNLFLIIFLTSTISIGIICFTYGVMFNTLPNITMFVFILLSNIISFLEVMFTQNFIRDLLEEQRDEL